MFQCEILTGPSVPYSHSLYLALGYSLTIKSWANNQRLRESALSLCGGQVGIMQQNITKFWPVIFCRAGTLTGMSTTVYTQQQNNARRRNSADYVI